MIDDGDVEGEAKLMTFKIIAKDGFVEIIYRYGRAPYETYGIAQNEEEALQIIHADERYDAVIEREWHP